MQGGRDAELANGRRPAVVRQSWRRTSEPLKTDHIKEDWQTRCRRALTKREQDNCKDGVGAQKAVRLVQEAGSSAENPVET